MQRHGAIRVGRFHRPTHSGRREPSNSNGHTACPMQRHGAIRVGRLHRPAHPGRREPSNSNGHTSLRVDNGARHGSIGVGRLHRPAHSGRREPSNSNGHTSLRVDKQRDQAINRSFIFLIRSCSVSLVSRSRKRSTIIGKAKGVAFFGRLRRWRDSCILTKARRSRSCCN